MDGRVARVNPGLQFLRRMAKLEPPSASRSARGVIILLLAVAAPQAQAGGIAVSALAPADTASPRATLKSFLDNMDEAFRAYSDGLESSVPSGTAALERALACLNTSQLPPVRARRLATETALMLQDVLDRVSLPAYEEIPDRRAMRDLPAGVPRVWRIPGTEKIGRAHV